MKPKPQKSLVKSAKNNTHAKSKPKQANFKHKYEPGKQKTQKPKQNKPELRKMIQQQKATERQKAKAEKDARIKEYKKQRLEKTKAISKRTQRGQPLMKDRMQLLLKQIEEMKRR